MRLEHRSSFALHLHQSLVPQRASSSGSFMHASQRSFRRTAAISVLVVFGLALLDVLARPIRRARTRLPTGVSQPLASPGEASEAGVLPRIVQPPPAALRPFAVRDLTQDSPASWTIRRELGAVRYMQVGKDLDECALTMQCSCATRRRCGIADQARRPLPRSLSLGEPQQKCLVLAGPSRRRPRLVRQPAATRSMASTILIRGGVFGREDVDAGTKASRMSSSVSRVVGRDLRSVTAGAQPPGHGDPIDRRMRTSIRITSAGERRRPGRPRLEAVQRPVQNQDLGVTEQRRRQPEALFDRHAIARASCEFGFQDLRCRTASADAGWDRRERRYDKHGSYYHGKQLPVRGSCSSPIVAQRASPPATPKTAPANAEAPAPPRDHADLPRVAPGHGPAPKHAGRRARRPT